MSSRYGGGVIRRFADLLPITEGTPSLTLDEGDTPLLDAPRLAEWVGVEELYLKYEGVNPTGSFKDRGMVVAVAKAMEAGARALLCASTGNTAASAAAYAARAGLRAVVLLPKGNVAAGKLSQAMAYGARALALDGGFDAALAIARGLADRYPLTLVNSTNPNRIEGQTTAAYEVCDVLGDAPDVLALPVGNGGNITAYALGFRRYRDLGRSTRLPRFVGVQAAGAAPLVDGAPVERPETIASAIRIGRPVNGPRALEAVRTTSGLMLKASDTAILEAYGTIARLEGVFCEPASAAGIAGLRAAVRDGRVDPGARCVCVLTGHGLKDPERAADVGSPVVELPATEAAVVEELGLDVV